MHRITRKKLKHMRLQIALLAKDGQYFDFDAEQIAATVIETWEDARNLATRKLEPQTPIEVLCEEYLTLEDLYLGHDDRNRAVSICASEMLSEGLLLATGERRPGRSGRLSRVLITATQLN